MSEPKKIRKAVFPVAGFGTRVLPATKSIPKEMLTVVDKPVIQYVVDEAREAGIEHFIFVTGRNKAVIEDYFDAQYELYATLPNAARPHCSTSCKASSPARERQALPASRYRWVLAMRSGARATSSATSLSRCFCRT